VHHCLKKEELRQVIDARRGEHLIADEVLEMRVQNAESWIDELAGLNYFMSHILERRKKVGESCDGILDTYFALDDRMDFVFQEFDFRFIDYMLRTVRDSAVSLEEELITLQNNVGEYRYDRTLRFRHNLAHISL
jgi:hypothetical protein